MKYEYYHPNHGWVACEAECDARNFQILNDWLIRIEGKSGFRDKFQAFNLGVTEHKIVEVLSEELYNSGGFYFVDTEIGPQHSGYIRPVEAEVFMTCPASDPEGMPQPLETSTHKLYFYKANEIKEGAYIRVKVPK